MRGSCNICSTVKNDSKAKLKKEGMIVQASKTCYWPALLITVQTRNAAFAVRHDSDLAVMINNQITKGSPKGNTREYHCQNADVFNTTDYNYCIHYNTEVLKYTLKCKIHIRTWGLSFEVQICILHFNMCI